ncbi:FAD/NAD(P)-binding protein [Bosea sp. AAP35]|uniref:FAD/NAD(P)-binding protein n=1 Tax=Bosea sp. AAP35 TaxID=1523417 RepID=UPI0006B9AA34|nr:FAD/NAD(P)-binding protein [Bosea sp. AAP35]
MTSIAIVGTGPSAIYALQALLACRRPLTVTLFEAGDIAGVGTPYDPRQNTIEMLANIASVEIPPVGVTLLDYLRQCDAAALARIGVDPDALGEREFYPRIALGAYYQDRLEALVASAEEAGHAVRILTRHRVVDVVPTGAGIDIRYSAAGSGPRSMQADKVILATGHVVPASGAAASLHATGGLDSAHAIGIFGSSLSAIDIAVSVATARGRFVEDRYIRDADIPPFTLTMMSRGGRLPEADFFCPLPAEAAAGFTEDDVAELVQAARPGTVLETVFARFARLLAQADPDYATRIGLDGLTADSFATAYFGERDRHAPFAWARHNLAEAERNQCGGHVVAWRYAILRSHEPFALCLDALTPDERDRFNAGLKRVFADNYAAVPPLSIKRLIALHDAGVLTVVKLPEGYTVETDEHTGLSRIGGGESDLVFDRIVDARGLAPADEDKFPFPTLRMVLMANRDLDEEREGDAVRVDVDYRLTRGINPLREVWCLSLPFLLDRKPFIQGLTSAAEMGRAAAEAIIGDLEGPKPEDSSQLDDLIEIIASTQPIILADSAVMLAPRSGSDAASSPGSR